ncbi:MAG: transposase [Candidatus Bathyarchaeia archaeon]
MSREALPLSIQVGPGNEHDSKRLIPLLEGLRIKYGRGRPREVTGDSAYLKRRGIKANIDVNPRGRRKPSMEGPISSIGRHIKA